MPFPQLNGMYCIEHIVTLYRLPRLLNTNNRGATNNKHGDCTTGALIKRAQWLLQLLPPSVARTEAMLVAVVLVAVKMTFALDGPYITAWIKAWSSFWPPDTPWIET